MNSHKNTRENTTAYFKYVLRQNWQHLIFYIILTLLVIVLPAVMNVNEYLDRDFVSESSGIYRLRTITSIISGITLFVSSAIAIFAGMSALSYINSRQAVGCFHSFPVTRSAVYFTETAVKAIYYLISLVPAILLSYLILEINLPLMAEHRILFFKMLLISVLSFCLFYSIMLFAAGLTGTGLLRFLMFGVTCLLPIAVYALICYSSYLGMPDVDFDAYLRLSTLKWLCPVTFIWDITSRTIDGNSNLLLSAILMILPAAVFYLAGYLLHRKRKSESSGTSIIWKPVFIIIKYAVMFVCTLFGGLVFGSGLFSGSEGGIWFIFGEVCGLILSFLLANVILYRSVRSMFKGLPGLGIMAVVMAVFTAFTAYDAAGINEHVYSGRNTKSIVLTLDGTEVTFTDKEDLDALTDMLRSYMKNKDELAYEASVRHVKGLNPADSKTGDDIKKYLSDYLEKYYYEKYYEDIGATAVRETGEGTEYTVNVSPVNFQIKWKQTPNFGIPAYRSTSIHYIPQTAEMLEYIVHSDEYAQTINQVVSYPAEDIQEMNGSLFHNTFSYYIDDKELTEEEKAAMRMLYTRLQNSYSFSTEKRDNSPAIGWFRVWDYDYLRKSAPVYASDIEIVSILAEHLGVDRHFSDTEDVYAYLADETTALFLIDESTGNTVSLTEAEQKEIFRYLPAVMGTSTSVPMNRADSRYIAIIVRPDLNTDEYNRGTYITYAISVRPEYENEAAGFFR